MKRFAVAGGILLLIAQVGDVHGALAAPPGPPPPPDCKSCPGPPPPPTLLPTPEATLVPSQQVVEIHLAPTHVSRGHAAKITINSAGDEAVTITVRYKGAKKPSVSHSKVGSTGTLVKTWTVSRNAPLGNAQVKVDIKGEDQPFTATLVVTK